MLIGINGYKNVGKDTVANVLVTHHDFTHLAFADKLKDSVAALFSITREQIEEYKNDENIRVCIYDGTSDDVDDQEIMSDMTFRHMLQRYGTESHRDIFGEDFWLKQVLPTSTKNVCISDARFNNELEHIHNCGGFNVRITRPGYDQIWHKSERIPNPELIDYTIENDGTLDDLSLKVAYLILSIKSKIHARVIHE